MPAVLHSGLENLIGIRHVIPHGDPCHRPESCGSEDQRAIAPGHDGVVRELILYYDIGNHRRADHARRLLAPPAKYISQRLQAANHCFQRPQLIVRQTRPVANQHAHLTETPNGRPFSGEPERAKRATRVRCNGMLGATLPFQVDAGAASILRRRGTSGRGGRRGKENRNGLRLMRRPTGNRQSGGPSGCAWDAA